MSNGTSIGKTVRRASPELAAAIEVLAGDGVRQADPTLGELRGVLQEVMWSVDGELLFPQDRTALVIELDELIDACGAQACAAGLVVRSTE